MKLTKERWKEISDRVIMDCRPTQNPIAMKFIRTQEEFDAIQNLQYCQNKASVCKLMGMAAHFPGKLRADPRAFLRHLLRHQQRLLSRDRRVAQR